MMFSLVESYVLFVDGEGTFPNPNKHKKSLPEPGSSMLIWSVLFCSISQKFHLHMVYNNILGLFSSFFIETQ